MSVHKPSDVQLFVPDQSALYSNSGQPNNVGLPSGPLQYSGIVGLVASLQAVDNVGQPQVGTVTENLCNAASGGQPFSELPSYSESVGLSVTPQAVYNVGQPQAAAVTDNPCNATNGGQPLSDPPPYSESVGLSVTLQAVYNVGQPQAAAVTDKPCNVTSGGQPNVVMIAGQPHVVTNDGRTLPLTSAQVPPPQAMIRTSKADVADKNGVLVKYRDPMWLSILSVLCWGPMCCAILGLYAMAKAHEARESFKARDFANAKKASQTARRVAIAGIVIGTILYLSFLTSR